ncbi:acyl transferase/acyl hydrolase/lysophospholipase [Desarmillaria tabescens]|uniref:Acyl transferase/acyl hydrolase/lysophospholipase n=1 Tax=Armillaria tabescens TaxID=1929756 RepID=A0AA39JNT4_ARMTA|nr:acyl transferase/acyl hydrolase/lysophospholipase [Desarmillaria tabescens]KAK0446048.1 acyl transferase/acyl hydrolase/lysophospholipase [Desarmillaria tabescens]
MHIDGGGIRGLSSLLILYELMWRIKQTEGLSELPLPCEYFDLIGGTSTGGLIALMVGRLRMSVGDAIECYGRLSRKVFGKPKHGVRDGKFRATKLEEVLKSIVSNRTHDADTEMVDDNYEACKTFVCAMDAHNMNAAIPVLFCTYTHHKEKRVNCAIWQAARATSAAPTFFKRIEIGLENMKQPYIDGGMGRNNPAKVLLEEAKQVFPGRRIACLISIGTGRAQTIAIPRPGWFQRTLPLGVINALQMIATDCERTAEELARDFYDMPDVYFRFNVEHGLQGVKLAQWDRLGEVASHTTQYLKTAAVDQKVDRAVSILRGGRLGGNGGLR